MNNARRNAVLSVLVSLVFVAGASVAQAATSTSFSPTTLPIAPGGSATITISTVGVLAAAPPNPRTIWADYTLIVPAGYTVSNVACIGIFAGATPSPDPIVGGAISCHLPWGPGPGVSGPTGDVLTFTLTRGPAAGLGTVTIDAATSSYMRTNESSEPVGTTNAVAAADATLVPALGRTGIVVLALLLGLVGVLVFRRSV